MEEKLTPFSCFKLSSPFDSQIRGSRKDSTINFKSSLTRIKPVYTGFNRLKLSWAPVSTRENTKKKYKKNFQNYCKYCKFKTIQKCALQSLPSIIGWIKKLFCFPRIRGTSMVKIRSDAFLAFSDWRPISFVHFQTHNILS